MRLGVDSMEIERSQTKSLARGRAVPASSLEGTRASNDSHEQVPCGKRIPHLNVGTLGLRPPPVGQVQQLQCEKRAVGRQVSHSVEITNSDSDSAARSGDSVIVIVRKCCVSLKVVEVVVARPSVKRGDMSPVVQGSVDDACEEPLCPCRRIRENCASHGCFPRRRAIWISCFHL